MPEEVDYYLKFVVHLSETLSITSLGFTKTEWDSLKITVDETLATDTGTINIKSSWSYPWSIGTKFAQIPVRNILYVEYIEELEDEDPYGTLVSDHS